MNHVRSPSGLASSSSLSSPSPSPQREDLRRSREDLTEELRTLPFAQALARLSPERGSPDRSSPDRSSPDRSSPDRSSPDRSSPDRGSPARAQSSLSDDEEATGSTASASDSGSESSDAPTFLYRRWAEAPVARLQGWCPERTLVKVDVDESGEIIWGPNPRLLDDSGGEEYEPSEASDDDSDGEHSSSDDEPSSSDEAHSSSDEAHSSSDDERSSSDEAHSSSDEEQSTSGAQASDDEEASEHEPPASGALPAEEGHEGHAELELDQGAASESGATSQPVSTAKRHCRRDREEADSPVSLYDQLLHLHMAHMGEPGSAGPAQASDREEDLHVLETVKGDRRDDDATRIERERFSDRGQSGFRTTRVDARILERKTTGRPGAPEPENGFRCSTSRQDEDSSEAHEGEAATSSSHVRRVRNTGRNDVEKGHILALQNGGPDIPENIVPQWGKWQGSGIWRRHETYALQKSKEIAKKTKGHALHMEVRPHYKGAADSIATFTSKTFPSCFSIKLTEIDEHGEIIEGGFKEIHWLYAHQNVTDDKLALRITKSLDDASSEDERAEQEVRSDGEPVQVEATKKPAKKKSAKKKPAKKSTKKRLHPFDEVEVPELGTRILNDVPGDGDCAYHAALGASGDRRSVEELRSATADNMAQAYPTLPRGYIARVRHRGTWSTNLELRQMARALEVTIHVHTFTNDGEYLQHDVFGDAGEPIHLAHTGYNHFQILRRPDAPRHEFPIPDDDVGAPEPEPQKPGEELVPQ